MFANLIESFMYFVSYIWQQSLWVHTLPDIIRYQNLTSLFLYQPDESPDTEPDPGSTSVSTSSNSICNEDVNLELTLPLRTLLLLDGFLLWFTSPTWTDNSLSSLTAFPSNGDKVRTRLCTAWILAVGWSTSSDWTQRGGSGCPKRPLQGHGSERWKKERNLEARKTSEAAQRKRYARTKSRKAPIRERRDQRRIAVQEEAIFVKRERGGKEGGKGKRRGRWRRHLVRNFEGFVGLKSK